MTVELAAPSGDWPRQFHAERALLIVHLAPWLAGEVEHIGSTAVPGLTAKPILDMLAAVLSLDEAAGAVPVLVGLGYEQGTHRPQEALWFCKAGPDGRRSHQLHLTRTDSDLWRERLAFRDALRGSGALREEYEGLKRRLAVQGGALADYTSGKRAFVARVLAGAGIALR